MYQNPYLTHNPNQITNGNYKIDKQDDRLYYNVVMSYNPIVNGESPMIFQQELTESLIQNPSDYYLSIIRFTIPTQNIPLFIAEVRPFPNTNLDSLIYSVRLNWNGFTSGEVFLDYLTTSPFAQPSKPLTASHPEADKTPYYYVFTYTQFLTMINNALQTAFTALSVASGGTLPAGSRAPYFIFDEINERISLIAQRAFYNIDTTVVLNPIRIVSNYKLFTFLDGLAIFLFSKNSPTGDDVQYIVRDDIDNAYQPNTIVPTVAGALEWFIMTQQYPTLVDWNSFKSLVLTSNLLPIRNEYVPSAQAVQNNSGQVNTRGILKDFEPLLELGPEARTVVQYQIQSPYQLINMLSTAPLTKVDIAIYWTDQFQNQYLLTIPFNQVVTIKMVFIKKSTFEGY